VETARLAPLWAVANFVAVLIFSVELKFGFLRHLISFDGIRLMAFALEFLATLIFLANTIWNVYLYTWMYLWMKPIELTDTEMRLLGVNKNELGFTPYVPKALPEKDKSALESPKKPEIQLSPNFSISPNLDTSHRSLVQSPMSPSSPGNSPFNTSSTNVSVNASSWVYNSGNASGLASSPSHSSSPLTTVRKRNVVIRTPENEMIRDSRTLQTYLDDYEELESKRDQLKDAESKQSSETWNLSASAQTPPPQASRNSGYQPADDSFVLDNWYAKQAEAENAKKPLISRQSK
jgi:hypothetical protein